MAGRVHSSGTNRHWFNGFRIECLYFFNAFHQVVTQILIRRKTIRLDSSDLGMPAPLVSKSPHRFRDRN